MQFISDDAVQAFRLTPDTVIPIAENTLHGIARGDIVVAPRPTISTRDGVRFMAFPAILEEVGIAGVKWLGTTSGPSAGGRGGSVIVLSKTDSAKPFAVVDARRITATRTACVSLLAALVLARRDSHRIAFVACGEQARLHLAFFAQRFEVRSVASYSRSMETASQFADFARQALGCEAHAYGSLQECVHDADIVISSTPSPSSTLLKAEWLDQSCFCSLVDLGRSFDTQGLPADSTFVVDDLPQFDALSRDGNIAAFEKVTPSSLLSVLEANGFGGGSGGYFLPTGLGAIDIRLAYELCKQEADAVATPAGDNRG